MDRLWWPILWTFPLKRPILHPLLSFYGDVTDVVTDDLAYVRRRIGDTVAAVTAETSRYTWRVTSAAPQRDGERCGDLLTLHNIWGLPLFARNSLHVSSSGVVIQPLYRLCSLRMLHCIHFCQRGFRTAGNGRTYRAYIKVNCPCAQLSKTP